MSIPYRPMRPKDVAACVAIVAAHPMVGPRYAADINLLSPAWLSLLGCEAFRAIVFEELLDSRMRLIAAATSAFVADEFVRELKTPPFFWIGPELARGVIRGRSPLLTNDDVRSANSKGGLNLVLWQSCVDPTQVWRADVRSQVSSAMVEQNRGFWLKEMIALQASFPDNGLPIRARYL